MEWMKQAEEIFKAWTDAQRTMWDEWIKTTQSFGTQPFGKMQVTDSWKRTAEAWEESVKKSLHLQMEWSKLWAESFSNVKGTPREFQEFARQGHDMMMRWAETQVHLWTAWLEMMKKLDPNALGGSAEKGSDKFLHLWEENLKNLLNVQAEWGRAWTATQAGKQSREQAKQA
jgi:hypothetical protein